ncbi:MAG: 3-phosphoshikimate 1-carboxyvinyltransferase [Bacteroides sp.]|jgi:3-phosphoshikimate 1-carboxyvinyltransferase|nr:3-phosphoshikimate 1-carboxyvinyltransferase [Bacteroides sp.]
MENLLLVTAPEGNIVNGKVSLPASKSIANRVLIIRALSVQGFNVHNLSDAEDTLILTRALESLGITPDINAGHTGTAMRFLTAFLATRPGTYYLTGSERMKERPIGPLVSALQHLGADIEYQGKAGFPPLKIKGKRLTGGKVDIDADTSSQFITSLLLIAPTFQEGLEITLKGKPVSTSYIKMTLGLMSYFGIETRWERNVIQVSPGLYQSKDITIEPDWSAASYFYEALLLSEKGKIFFPMLSNESLQGDEVVWQWFDHLGITTTFSAEGATAEKTRGHPEFVSFGFNENPDLAQTMAMAFAGRNIQAVFRGLETLPLKETDRIKALQTELAKLGYILAPREEGIWQLRKTSWPVLPGEITFQTYHDHRMAMACAPLALVKGQVDIRDPEVVGKSFPKFWECLRSTGFKLVYEPRPAKK